MNSFMEGWRQRTLTESNQQEPDETSYERTVLLLIQNPKGCLESVVEVYDAWPDIGVSGILHYDESQQLTTVVGREIVKKLFCGGSVNSLSFVDLWHCELCGWETREPEGLCPTCGHNLELFGVIGPAPDTYKTKVQPQPADVSLPSSKIDENVDDSSTAPEYIPSWHRLWRNWPVHNILAHPVQEMLSWVGLSKLAAGIHNRTLPASDKGR